MGLIELYFFCFTANNWLDLQKVGIARNSSIVMSDNVTSTNTAHRLVNEGIEWLPIITAVLIN